MTASRDTYSHGHHASVLRSHGWRTAENSAAYLLAVLEPDARVLDVGTGPGTITCDLADRVPQGFVVGIDNAEAAIEATRRLAGQRGTGNLTLAVGDVYALDWPDEHFDVIHAHQVLQHLSDPVAALQEMGRVCRPGGLVAARDADYGAMTWFPDSPALERWVDLYRRVARHNCGEPDAGRRLKSWFRQAGLSSLEVSASTWSFASETDLGWWSQTWSERLLHSDFARQALDAGLSDPTELATLSRGWLEWAAAPDAWFAVVHAEVLARPSARSPNRIGPARAPIQ